MVELFHIKSIQFNSRPAVYSATDFGDLYGGGRKGATNEYAYGDEDEDDNHSAFEREQQAKKETTNFIQKQLALRRNPQEMSQNTIEKLFSKHARVKAASSSSNKVNGLTLATREQYLTRILDVLYSNYSSCEENATLDKKDVEDCCVDLEYSIFSSNTTMTMYRNGVAKMISNIKKSTAEKKVYEKLQDFTPKPAKNETLADLFRNIKKEQQLQKASETASNNSVFKTAYELLNETNTKSQLGSDLCSNNSQKKITDLFNNIKKTKEEDMATGEHVKKRDLRNLFGEEDFENQSKLHKSDDDDPQFDTDFHSFNLSKDSDSPEDIYDKPHKHEKESHHRHDKGRSRHHDEKHRKDRHKHGDNDRKRRHSSSDKERDEDAKRRSSVFDEQDKSNGSSLVDDFKTASETTSDLESKYNDFLESTKVKEPTRESETVEVHRESEKSDTQNGETSSHDNKSSKPKLKKTEIGLLVVKLLTPAYIERRFESRDVFKSMARTISHSLADKDENEIKEYVQHFLKKNSEITSHTTL